MISQIYISNLQGLIDNWRCTKLLGTFNCCSTVTSLNLMNAIITCVKRTPIWMRLY